jgi:hypothetical protein
MKSTLKLLATLALVLATFSQYTATRAAPNYGFTFKGLSTDASFFSTDPSGCISTGVFVFGLDQALRYPQSENKQPVPQVSVSLYQSNTCTETQLVSAHGEALLGKHDFVVAGNLDSASLSAATVHMFDYQTGTPFDISVNITWKAVGPVNRQNSQYTYNFQNCHANSHYQGTMRFAEATGIVSDGSTNFTPSSSSNAQISSSKSGDVSSGCED